MSSSVSIDPITQLSSGQTPFSYAGNNPGTFIDFYGLVKFKPMGVIQSSNASIGSLFASLGNFISSPAGAAIGFGIQAAIALNQPVSAADFDLGYLAASGGTNSGCCPENQGPESSYADLKNDPLVGVKATSGLFELLGFGELYMLGRTAYVSTIRPLLVDGLKYSLTKMGYKVAAKGVTTVLEGPVKSNYVRFIRKIPSNSKSSSSFQLLDDGNY